MNIWQKKWHWYERMALFAYFSIFPKFWLLENAILVNQQHSIFYRNSSYFEFSRILWFIKIFFCLKINKNCDKPEQGKRNFDRQFWGYDSTRVTQDLPCYFPVIPPSTNSLKKAVIHTWPAKKFTNPEDKLGRKKCQGKKYNSNDSNCWLN